MHTKRFNPFLKDRCNSVWVQFHVYYNSIIGTNYEQDIVRNILAYISSSRGFLVPKESNLFTRYNFICIPESFNTDISQHLFDYIITFVN